jgi:TPR repeat protein
MARHHFLAAAAGGLPTAFNGLGVLFYHGQGVEVNLTEAFRYFKLGSLVDHDAAYNLGNMYQVWLCVRLCFACQCLYKCVSA